MLMVFTGTSRPGSTPGRLVFAQRFSDVQSSGTAFAVNLLGAMAGGALEYMCLITGYHVLLVVTGVLYALAFVTGLRGRSAPRPA